jgi:hypothetical protein
MKQDVVIPIISATDVLPFTRNINWGDTYFKRSFVSEPQKDEAIPVIISGAGAVIPGNIYFKHNYLQKKV